MALGLDPQGWITVLAGVLLALITLFTSYDHVDLFGFIAIRLNQQIGLLVIAASLATLVGEAQLASRRRLRDQRERAQEADEAAQERELAARRAQRQTRCTLVQLRYQLDPTAFNAGRVRDMIALLEDYGDLG